MSFPPYKCFRTFAVWKHFSIYPYPSRGRTCPTRNSSFSSANILSAWDSLTNSDRYRRLYQRIFAIEFSILRIGEYPIPSIIDTLNFTAHPPPTYSVNGRLPTLQRSSKATDIKKKQVGISSEILF